MSSAEKQGSQSDRLVGNKVNAIKAGRDRELYKLVKGKANRAEASLDDLQRIVAALVAFIEIKGLSEEAFERLKAWRY